MEKNFDATTTCPMCNKGTFELKFLENDEAYYSCDACGWVYCREFEEKKTCPNCAGQNFDLTRIHRDKGFYYCSEFRYNRWLYYWGSEVENFLPW